MRIFVNTFNETRERSPLNTIAKILNCKFLYVFNVMENLRRGAPYEKPVDHGVLIYSRVNSISDVGQPVFVYLVEPRLRWRAGVHYDPVPKW